MGSKRGLEGRSTTLLPLRLKVFTVASSPGMPATTMSPSLGLGLLADDDVVAVEDAGVDHRVAPNLEHEQLPVSGEVLRQGQELLDVLLGQHVGARGHLADQGDMSGRPPVDPAPSTPVS